MDIIKKYDAPDVSGDEKPNAGKTPEQTETGNAKEEHPKDHKSFKEKVKDALQDWSNDNERDIEEDDNTPLRSGL